MHVHVHNIVQQVCGITIQMMFHSSCLTTDDEPPDGPSRFFILTGFTSLEFLQHLPTVGLTAHMLVKATGSQPVPFNGGKYMYMYHWHAIRTHTYICTKCHVSVYVHTCTLYLHMHETCTSALSHLHVRTCT